MKPQIIFVTGTDTDAGKTVFATLLTRHAHAAGVKVAALKPVCSGGRDDARQLRRAAGNVLTLDEVNPWHFRAALSPLLAARRERKKIRLSQIVRHVASVARRFDLVIVEGAGGLLSPMGDGFDSRDLILALKAKVAVVAPNRLGAVNQVLLVLDALPARIAKAAQVVLMNPPRANPASRTNPALLSNFFPAARIQVMPWLTSWR
jgi:dethiobiotin synthetase